MKKRIGLWLMSLGFLLALSQVASAAMTFRKLTREHVGDLVSEFTADTYHNSVTPPSRPTIKFLDFFGVELGITYGAVRTGRLQELDEEDTGYLWNGMVFGALSLPSGFAVDFGWLPQWFHFGGQEVGHFGGGVKWTLTDVFDIGFPINIALNAHGAITELSWNQVVNSVDTDITFEDTVYGGSLAASKKVGVFEPYIGAGYITGDGEISVLGTNTTNFFANAVTINQRVDSQEHDVHLFGGFNVELSSFVIGLEYARAFSVDRFTGKFSFKF